MDWKPRRCHAVGLLPVTVAELKRFRTKKTPSIEEMEKYIKFHQIKNWSFDKYGEVSGIYSSS